MRFEDWPAKLDAEIRKAQNREFAWGRFDCALFAADVVLALTGIDYAEPFRGTYSSAEECETILKSLRFWPIERLLEDLFGAEVDPRLLQRGDVAIFDAGQGQTVGVCIGSQVLAPTEKGLVAVKARNCLKGWKI